MLRNIAAHDYETDCNAIAEHFNALETLSHRLRETGRRLIVWAGLALEIKPQTGDFEQRFKRLFDG